MPPVYPNYPSSQLPRSSSREDTRLPLRIDTAAASMQHAPSSSPSSSYSSNVASSPASSSSPLFHKYNPQVSSPLASSPTSRRVPSYMPRSNIDSAFPPFPDREGGVKVLNVYKLAGFDVNSHNYNYEQRVPIYTSDRNHSVPSRLPSVSREPHIDTSGSEGLHPSRSLYRQANISTQAQIGTEEESPQQSPQQPYWQRPQQQQQRPLVTHSPVNDYQRNNQSQTSSQSQPQYTESKPQESESASALAQRLGSTASTSSSSSKDSFSARGSTTSTSSSIECPSYQAQSSIPPLTINESSIDEFGACSPSPMDVDGGYSSSDEEMHFSSKVRILSQLQMTLTPSNPEFPQHILSTIPDEPDNGGALSDVSDEDIPSTPALNISSRRPWGNDRELEADESKPSRKSKKKHTCTACNQLIEGRSIRAPRDGSAPRSKHRWHKECFRCTVCQTPFDGLECYLSSDTRMPFCGACYHTRNGSLCCICGSGVEGPCVLVEEDDDEQYFTRKSHTDCFKCSECSIILNKSYYEMQRGEFMCEVHAIQTYNKLRARAFVSKGLPMSAQAVVSAQKRMSRIERRLTSTVVNIDPNQFNSGVPF